MNDTTTADETEQATLDEVAMTDGGDVEDHFDAEAETVTDAWEGAFIYTSWGYGQTNTEHAQIVDVSDSGKTVVAQMVAAETVENHKTTKEVRPTAERHGDTFRLHVRAVCDEPAFRGSYPYIDGDTEKGTRRDSFYPFGDSAGRSITATQTMCGH